MSASWATLTGAIRYGFAPYYILRIEGITTLLVEAVRDANAPTGYSLDASLVIDGSARIGSVLSDKDHFAGAKDLEFRLTDTPAVRALMGRPTAQTTITAEFAHDATTMAVDSTAGFPTAASTIYFGTSCLEKTGYLYDAFTALDRSVYGPAKTYPAGTVVTDSPGDWKRRRVELFMALLDPCARYVVTSGGDILSQACCVWTGYMSARPVRNGTEWECIASDQVQTLRAPLSASAQGTASWALDQDGLQHVGFSHTICMKVRQTPVASPAIVTEVAINTFSDGSTLVAPSRARKLIADKLLARILADNPSSPIDFIGWKQETSPDGDAMRRVWRMWFHSTQTDAETRVTISVSSIQAGIAVEAPLKIWLGATENYDTQLIQRTQVVGGSLAVVIEEGDPADLPTAGFIRLEGGDKKQILEYTSLSVDAGNGAKVHLQLDPGSQPIGSDLVMLAADDVSGESAELSVTFLWRDEGPVEDVMRRAIVSTGDGVNGAHDTLARGRQPRQAHAGGVGDGVDDGRRGRDQGALPQALGAERPLRVRALDEDRLDLGDVVRGRDAVLREAPRDAGDELLGQREPDAHDHGALHLAARAHRVQDAADVVRRHDAPHAHRAGAHVHVHLGHLARRGIGGVRAAEAGRGIERHLARDPYHLATRGADGLAVRCAGKRCGRHAGPDDAPGHAYLLTGTPSRAIAALTSSIE